MQFGEIETIDAGDGDRYKMYACTAVRLALQSGENFTRFRGGAGHKYGHSRLYKSGDLIRFNPSFHRRPYFCGSTAAVVPHYLQLVLS
jgi:hypothetical protein